MAREEGKRWKKVNFLSTGSRLRHISTSRARFSLHRMRSHSEWSVQVNSRSRERSVGWDLVITKAVPHSDPRLLMTNLGISRSIVWNVRCHQFYYVARSIDPIPRTRSILQSLLDIADCYPVRFFFLSSKLNLQILVRLGEKILGKRI